MKSEINNRVVWARKKAGLKQSEAAERLGMKSSTYSQMERSGSIPADKLLDMSNAFRVSPVDFLFDEGVFEFCNKFHPDLLGRQAVDTVHQPNPFEPEPPKPSLTKQEESIISILRNLPKKDYEDAVKYIEALYKKNKYK